MKRKVILFVILAVFAIAGIGGGGYYLYQSQHYIMTEDSRLAGDIYRVMPRISAKVTSLQIEEGDYVLMDQKIGQQDSGSLSTSLLEQAVLRSPIEGTVIKTSVHEGEVASPGQTVAMVVNLDKLYISANVEETDLSRIHEGQRVDIRIDTFPDAVLSGKVFEIGNATASTFALLPSSNTSGNFTKVTQRIPIKITLDDQQGLKLSPGMNTSIKIHVKE